MAVKKIVRSAIKVGRNFSARAIFKKVSPKLFRVKVIDEAGNRTNIKVVPNETNSRWSAEFKGVDAKSVFSGKTPAQAFARACKEIAANA